MKKKILLIICLLALISIPIIYVLYHFNIIPHKGYYNDYFNIESYKSSVDKDQDGVDD